MSSLAEHLGTGPDVESALGPLIGEILAHEALTPEEILIRVRAAMPGITLDRVLITLYENATIFRRSRGRWCAGTHSALSSYPHPTLAS